MDDKYTEYWTREEIIDSLTSIAKHRFNKTLQEFIDAVKSKEIVTGCEHMEVMAILNFLPKDDPIWD